MEISIRDLDRLSSLPATAYRSIMSSQAMASGNSRHPDKSFNQKRLYSSVEISVRNLDRSRSLPATAHALIIQRIGFKLPKLAIEVRFLLRA